VSGGGQMSGHRDDHRRSQKLELFRWAVDIQGEPKMAPFCAFYNFTKY